MSIYATTINKVALFVINITIIKEFMDETSVISPFFTMILKFLLERNRSHGYAGKLE